MLDHALNEAISRVGPGTPMGDAMRRYWLPALLTLEIPEPDCPPVRVTLMGAVSYTHLTLPTIYSV